MTENDKDDNLVVCWMCLREFTDPADAKDSRCPKADDGQHRLRRP